MLPPKNPKLISGNANQPLAGGIATYLLTVE